ncbi:MAG TPA: hypothetical protein VKH20_06345 [Solirubrobacterales bacterium]|nr:hypothetical protein [Solirubrobacterales bacterium]
MYFLGLIAILLIALAIFFSPIFALLLMVLFLIGLGLYKFLGPGTEPDHMPVGEAPAGGAPVTSKREATEQGMWGEKRPEEQASGEEAP